MKIFKKEKEVVGLALNFLDLATRCVTSGESAVLAYLNGDLTEASAAQQEAGAGLWHGGSHGGGWQHESGVPAHPIGVHGRQRPRSGALHPRPLRLAHGDALAELCRRDDAILDLHYLRYLAAAA